MVTNPVEFFFKKLKKNPPKQTLKTPNYLQISGFMNKILKKSPTGGWNWPLEKPHLLQKNNQITPPPTLSASS